MALLVASTIIAPSARRIVCLKIPDLRVHPYDQFPILPPAAEHAHVLKHSSAIHLLPFGDYEDIHHPAAFIKRHVFDNHLEPFVGILRDKGQVTEISMFVHDGPIGTPEEKIICEQLVEVWYFSCLFLYANLLIQLS